ncbi:ATP-binding protein [Rhodoplanes azumiensis]|uniref:histidine kinase n=1 Tax=Rhodoplanes azumiensis TaxID=1897628 RepID=A0ABW5AI13_9BRAD
MGDLSADLSALLRYRLTVHAVAAAPVWLWSTDATRLLFANPAGAAVLGGGSFADLADRRFDPADPMGAQVARLAATLYPSGTTILHRLRGFGAPLGRALLCACTRVTVDGRGAVLVVAQEPAGPRLSFAERVRRLCAAFEVPVAAYAADGTRIASNPAGAQASAGAAPPLATLIARALAEGGAAGDGPSGPVEIVRVGEGAETALLARLSPAATAAGEIAAVGDRPEADRPEPATAVVAPQPVGAAADIAEPEPAPEVEPEGDGPGHAAAVDAPALAESPPPVGSAAGGASEGGAAATVRDDEAEWRDDADADASDADLSGPDSSRPDALDVPRPATSGPDPETPRRIDGPATERRYPLRFVWQMDAEGRFTLGSDEFAEVIGPRVALALGRPWREIAAALGLDPDGRVLRAVETRDTWSGIVVSFPVDGSEDRLDVELSGLPVYDRARTFLGYRGFGVCRDLGRLADFARLRRAPVFTIGEAVPSPSVPSPVPGPAIGPVAEEQPDPAAPENVVRFPVVPDPRSSAPAAAALTAGEHNAFHEIARQLQARLGGPDEGAGAAAGEGDVRPSVASIDAAAGDATACAGVSGGAGATDATGLIDRLPVGVLVYRYDELLFANRSFLTTTGYPDLDALAAAGGLDSLFVAGDADLAATTPGPHGQALAILTRRGDRKPVAARLFAISWAGESAFALVLAAAGEDRTRAGDVALRRAEATIRELHALLDTAFDGVVVLTRDGRIVSASHSAEVLFGAEAGGLAETPFEDLFAGPSRDAVRDTLARVRRSGRVSLDAGREVTGAVRGGGAVPLAMTMGPMSDGSDRLCVVFRDLSAHRAGAPSAGATLAFAPAGPAARAHRPAAGAAPAERAVGEPAGVVAKLGHGLRTPLTAVMGFTDLMLEERYGPVGNERYRGYLRDVRAAAQQMAGLIDDTLSLSQAESGTLELTFVSVDLNEIVREAVKSMQPQANRERIIIRSSLAPRVPPIVADTRSLHQIILNLIGNAIRLGGPGGQVIVSTGQNDRGQVVLRVRDTGHGMSQKDLQSALQADTRADTAPPAGNGLGLPLTKALAEANRGTFAITSRVNDGTLVEVTFPRPKIPAE